MDRWRTLIGGVGEELRSELQATRTRSCWRKRMGMLMVMLRRGRPW